MLEHNKIFVRLCHYADMIRRLDDNKIRNNLIPSYNSISSSPEQELQQHDSIERGSRKRKFYVSEKLNAS